MFGNKQANKIAAGEPYKVYGRAGATMTDKTFQKKVGNYANSAGARGEKILFEKLRKQGGWLPADTPLFCSLKVPGKQSDIDFAVVRGDRVLLIDAKLYRQDGGFYWNTKGSRNQMKRNLSTYTTKNGKPMELSRSMDMARDVIARHLPGFKVEAMVVMTTDDNNANSVMPTVWGMKFPGDIKVCNDKTAARYIRKFLGGQSRTTDTYNAEKFLRKYVQ